MLNTLVAFIIFRRPEVTRKMFEAIRQAKSNKLLVIADDARLTHPKLMVRDLELDNLIQERFPTEPNPNLQSRILRKAKNFVAKVVAR